MIDIVEQFDTKAAAEARRKALLGQYHPAGYGTQLRVDPGSQHGVWWLTGFRFSSCD